MYLVELECTTGNVCSSPTCYWGFSGLFTVERDISEKKEMKNSMPICLSETGYFEF